MTPFAIFAFVLTFGYFIYFAVMITLDLHAKPADGQKNEEEDIDVEGMKDEGVEAPKVISEAADLEGGRVTYTDTTTDDGLRVISPTGTIVQSPEEEEPVVDPDPAPEEKEKKTSEELNEENEYGMEDIEPEAQHSMYADEFYAMINENHKNTRNIKKENVRDHLYKQSFAWCRVDRHLAFLANVIFSQMWRSRLQLGSRCAVERPRLYRHHDALCGLSVLCDCRIGSRHRSLANLHQDADW